MPRVIKIKRGLDIRLLGTAEKIYISAEKSRTYAVKPPDFPGLIPKLTVKPGDQVLAGTTLFFNKYYPDIRFSSPVSGEVKSVNRGERRRILEVVIEAESGIRYVEYKPAKPLELIREDIIKKMLESGLWPMIRQRPYAIVANPERQPRDIFISGFDTAPLAPDMDFIVKGNTEDFQIGIDALSQLTEGKIHLSLNGQYPADEVFAKAKKVEFHYFTGPHPAGNPGIQIHHLRPVNKGEVVWYVQPQEVIMIGRLFRKGVYDAAKVIALTGSEVKKPLYYKLLSGASIEPLIKDNVTPGNHRYISGNVLSGSKITKIGHIGFYDNQVTIIPEGDKFEFLGWAAPGLNKFSNSRTFMSWMMVGKKYRAHTNINGGRRAFVMSGEYEKVLPMDIYPVHLLKAILVEDIDRMENLGIYEIAEEDFALCEYVCTSKIEVQSLVRKGIEMMIREVE
ncbi:MAG: Na(+)-translocating NADH-quinone reductase subunit A [Bacteroides sp. SM23_62_1]|nr:MAG: Na(+)-translocating NADH-quinone reductase subunit A [Bacteroides sp. SM23_62_1]